MVQFPLPSVEPGAPARATRVLVLIVAASLAFALLAIGISGLAYQSLIRGSQFPVPRSQAEATAIHTIAEAQQLTAPTWRVRHSNFHPYSATVSDSSGAQRIVSSWNSCVSGDVGRKLDQEGILCPPPPVWAIEVQTSSRPTNHKALVEIDALSGAVMAWFIDDTLP